MITQSKSKLKNRNQDIAWLALLIAVGLIIFVIEFFIPRPLPWLKPGLANVATLMALYIFGFKEALIVVIGRVLLGSLIVGSFLNPAFILAMGGGIAATMLMALTKRYGSGVFSIFGISVIGAVTHNIVQLILIFAMLIHQFELFYMLPILIFSSLFTGIIVALMSHYLLISINKHYRDF